MERLSARLFAFADAKLPGINAAMDAEVPNFRRNAEEIAKFQRAKGRRPRGDADVRHREPGRAFLQKEKHGVGARRPRVPHRDTEAQNPQGLYVGGGAGAAQRVQPGCPTSEEVAKDKLLADRENEDMPELMQKVASRSSDETFFVEPKKRGIRLNVEKVRNYEKKRVSRCAATARAPNTTPYRSFAPVRGKR